MIRLTQYQKGEISDFLNSGELSTIRSISLALLALILAFCAFVLWKCEERGWKFASSCWSAFSNLASVGAGLIIVEFLARFVLTCLVRL